MLEQAIKEALKNPIRPRGRNSISRFAAVLTDGKHTYIGLNNYKSHPLQARFGREDYSGPVHAELDAIIQGIRARAKEAGVHYSDITDFKGYKLAVARVLKDNSPALAKPCSSCMKAIEAFNINSVEWTYNP